MALGLRPLRLGRILNAWFAVSALQDLGLYCGTVVLLLRPISPLIEVVLLRLFIHSACQHPAWRQERSRGARRASSGEALLEVFCRLLLMLGERIEADGVCKATRQQIMHAASWRNNDGKRVSECSERHCEGVGAILDVPRSCLPTRRSPFVATLFKVDG